MTTPTHVAANLIVFAALSQVSGLHANYLDLSLMISTNLIDLDHLFSKPIYHPRRNPFKTHFLHRNLEIMLALSTACLFIRPVMFLGLGILTHFLLDYLYVKREKL
jgi:hypothetical protein